MKTFGGQLLVKAAQHLRRKYAADKGQVIPWSDPVFDKFFHGPAPQKPAAVPATANAGQNAAPGFYDQLVWDRSGSTADNLRGWGSFIGANALPLALTFVPGVGPALGIGARALWAARAARAARALGGSAKAMRAAGTVGAGTARAAQMLGTKGQMGFGSRLGRMAAAGAAGSAAGSLAGSTAGSALGSTSNYGETALGHAFDPANLMAGAMQPLYFAAPGLLGSAAKGAWQAGARGAGQGVRAFNNSLAQAGAKGLESSVLNKLPGLGTNTLAGKAVQYGTNALVPAQLAGNAGWGGILGAVIGQDALVHTGMEPSMLARQYLSPQQELRYDPEELAEFYRSHNGLLNE